MGEGRHGIPTHFEYEAEAHQRKIERDKKFKRGLGHYANLINDESFSIEARLSIAILAAIIGIEDDGSLTHARYETPTGEARWIINDLKDLLDSLGR